MATSSGKGPTKKRASASATGPRKRTAAPTRRSAAKAAAPNRAAKPARPRSQGRPKRDTSAATPSAPAPVTHPVPAAPGGVATQFPLSINVVTMQKQPVGTVELSGPLFSTAPNAALLHEAVVMQQAAMRQGTADTKGRGEVSGTGRKPWKQKGTGRARAGSIRSPLWRKGGTVFGPTPRSYAYTFPRKKARAALAGAMTARVAQGDVVMLDRLAIAEPKTKLVAGLLKTLGLDGSVLIVHQDETGTLRRASANLPRVTVLDVPRLNVYDILAHRHIVLVQSDLPRLETLAS